MSTLNLTDIENSKLSYNELNKVIPALSIMYKNNIIALPQYEVFLQSALNISDDNISVLNSVLYKLIECRNLENYDDILL